LAASATDGSRALRLQAHMLDVVPAYLIAVTIVLDPKARTVVDQLVQRFIAQIPEADPRTLLKAAAKMVDVIVLHDVVCPLKRRHRPTTYVHRHASHFFNRVIRHPIRCPHQISQPTKDLPRPDT
jgi:hypothetical protein